MSAVTNYQSIDTAKILLAIKADLDAWARSLGGTVSLASDAFNVLEVLAEGPARWRGTILWRGKEVAGQEIVHTTMGGHTFSVIITAQHGAESTSAKSLYEGTAQRLPLMTIAEMLASRALAWRFPTNLIQHGFIYHVETQLYDPPADFALHAYDIKFRFRALAQIPADTINMELEQ